MARAWHALYVPKYPDMPGEELAKRFKAACLKAGVMKDAKRHAYAMSPSVRRRLKQKIARKLQRKRQQRIDAATASADRARFGSGA